MKSKSLLILVLAAAALFVQAPLKAEESVAFDAPIQLYLIEKTGVGKNEKISFSKTKVLFLKQLRVAGFHILDDLAPPFVSKGMTRYGVIHTGGSQSSGIGYVHLLFKDDEAVQYFSDSGQEVSLKSKPESLSWVFEQKRSLEMADKAGAKYAFVVELNTQLVYQDDSPKPVYKVDLSADLYQVDNGKVVFHHDESMVKLADTASEAILGACQFLSQKLVDELEANKKLQADAQ